jgi:hypothetical protein
MKYYQHIILGVWYGTNGNVLSYLVDVFLDLQKNSVSKWCRTTRYMSISHTILINIFIMQQQDTMTARNRKAFASLDFEMDLGALPFSDHDSGQVKLQVIIAD